MTKIKACSHFSLENIIWEVITGNAYPSRLIGFSIGPESLRIETESKMLLPEI